MNLDLQSISTFLFTRSCKKGVLTEVSLSIVQDNDCEALHIRFCRSSDIHRPTQLWWKQVQKPLSANGSVSFDSKRHFKLLNRGYHIGNTDFSRPVLLCEWQPISSQTGPDLLECHKKPRMSKIRPWGLHCSIPTLKEADNRFSPLIRQNNTWNLLTRGHRGEIQVLVMVF